jgi:RND family efflux transporter MFP subunit
VEKTSRMDVRRSKADAMRLRYVIIGMVLVGACSSAAYFQYVQRPVPAKVARVGFAPVAEFVYATGVVEPVQSAKVVPLQRGRLVELCRCEGQILTKGQVLARQDDSEERAVLTELEIRYQQLVRDRDRAEQDYKKGKVTKAEFEQRDTAAKEAQSHITAQQIRLETLVLRSPMDGMVLRRDGELGEIMGPPEVLFWVGQLSPLQIAADVNEEEITKIAVGQRAFLASEAFERQRLHATVSHITPKGDPTKKTFRVYLQLPSDTPLRIGMTVEANIIFREKQTAVLVPLEAVVGDYIQVVSDDQVRRFRIDVGVRGTHYVEVISGVSVGALVLSPARGDLKDGSNVRPEGPITLVANDSDAVSDGREAVSDTGSDLVDRAISTAFSAHIDSIVNDARRSALSR